MKTLKICAVFLLCALLAGCADRVGNADKEKNYEYYALGIEDSEKFKKHLEANRAAYQGKTVEIIFDTPETFTLSSAEGQTFNYDVNWAYGDLLWLNSPLSAAGVHNKFPYSDSYTLSIPADAPKDVYGFDVQHDSIRCGAQGSGVNQVSISNLNRCELEGNGTMEMISCSGSKKDEKNIDYRTLTLRGNGNKHITVEFTEKGAIATGFEGTCEISYFILLKYSSNDMDTTYTCDGGAFEVDVVSQPGEILVTPVEG